MLKIFEQRGFTLVELLAVMAIMAILAGVVSGAVVGLGSTGQNTRLAGDRNTIAKSADRFFTDAFPQTYPVVELDTNGDGDVDDDDEFDLPGGDLGVRVIDFDAILPHDATRSFVPDFLKEVPDSGALVSWRVDTSTGNVFFAEDGSALVRPSLARLDVSADNAQASTAESSFQSDHEFAITMRKGEAPINTIEMTIPAGYVIGGQQLSAGKVVGSLTILFDADNAWDTGNQLAVTVVPVEVVSGNRWKAVVDYDANSGGTTENIDVKVLESGADGDVRTHTITIVPPAGDTSPGILTLNLDRVNDSGAADFSDYEYPQVNEATEFFTLTLFDHPRDTLNGSDVTPTVNLITNPKTRGVYRWLAQQNTAIDIEGVFDGIAGNQAVVIKTSTASSTSEPSTPTPVPTTTTTVHFEEFEGTVSSSLWNPTTTDTTSLGSRSYLGPFTANEVASLTLTGLDSHSFAKVSFELFVIGDWDGDDGPDGWSFTVDSGMPEIDTTFSNTSALQAWGGNFSTSGNPAQTGSSEQDSLGFTGGDSVYTLSFTFPHFGSSLSLDFAGSGLEPIVETWGLDDVKVEIIN